MKALLYRAPRLVELAEVPDPTITLDHQAVVEVTLAGICGSDLHIWSGHGFSDDIGFTVGHEAVGIVREVGRAVSAFAPGDRVLVPGSVGCSSCSECFAGRVSSCTTLSKRWMESCYGLSHVLPGSQAQQVLVPHAHRNLVRVPDAVSDEAAVVLTDNGPTAWYGCRRGRVGPGDTVLVIGLGPVGLMSVQSAFVMGASRVLGVDPVGSRRARAEELGAETLLMEDDVKLGVRDLTGGAGADVVIEAVGRDETIDLAMRAARPGGRVSVVGVSQSRSMPFPMEYAQVKELEFAIGLCSVQAELPTLLTLTEHGRLQPDAVVSHRFSLADGAKAYELYGSRNDGVSKVVLEPAG